MNKPRPEILKHAKMVLHRIDTNDKSNAAYKNFCRLTDGFNNEQLLAFFKEFSDAIKYIENNNLSVID